MPTVCEKCGKTLIAEYDLTAVWKALSPHAIAGRSGTIWRYRELLPVMNDASVVSLGEGWTPMLRASCVGARLGLSKLYIKDEGLNLTGSCKARGLCVAVSKAKEHGIEELAMPSAGNAGGTLAAYAAKTQINAHVFVPKDTPRVNVEEIRLYGLEVVLVDATISDAAKKMNQERAGTHWFDASTMREPYRLEGKKTLGYELAEQFGWSLPDVVVYPTGGGTGLIGMWKAFNELEKLRWTNCKKPRMVSVQSSGCASVVKAFEERKQECEFWTGACTVASGLRVPKALADHLILSVLYESGGTAVAVSDKDLLVDMKLTAAFEGIFLCPEGAAGHSAIRHLVGHGFMQPSDSVLLFNTASGYEYLELLSGEDS